MLLSLLLAVQMPAKALETSHVEWGRREQAVSVRQSEKEQQALIEARGAKSLLYTRFLLMASGLMFLFGGFCAHWAQNHHREPLVWFFIGFLFNVFALGALLLLAVRDRRRRRYRHGMAYWMF